MNTRITIPLLVLNCAFCFSSFAQGNAFTYQGRVQSLDGPASGVYDVAFDLYNVASGGTSLASFTSNSVPVSNGLFAVTVDFGAGVFTGPDRWLEIWVRTNGAAVFTTLSPRQQISSAPYAIKAGDAAVAEGVSWSGVTGLPAGFADGVDNDTTYTAGTGLSLAGTVFSLNTTYADARYWKLGGNTGAGNFLGSLDNQPLELRVNNTRALRLQFTTTGEGPNIVGGAPNNSILGGPGSTIGGGGSVASPNSITGPYATISGGANNIVATEYATVGGGYQNTINDTNGTIAGGKFNSLAPGSLGSFSSTIGGGYNNHIAVGQAGTIAGGIQNHILGNSSAATVGGGYQNFIETNGFGGTIGGGDFNFLTEFWGTIGGGYFNTNHGQYGVVPGGFKNQAAGDYSLAAGRQAKANHDGTFVWADSQDADFNSTSSNQFLIRAAGGVGINTASPTAALEVGGAPGTDGIRFPDGTLQTTAPKPVFLSGVGLDPASTNQFLSVTVRLYVQSSSQSVLVTSHKAFGSTMASGASGLNLYVGFRPAGSTASPNVRGSGIFGNRVPPDTRVTMGLSGVISGLAPGSYDFGLVGNAGASATNWNFNEYSYTTAVLY